MKRNFLITAMLFGALFAGAQHLPQSYNNYVPFHQYLQQHHADLQRQRNSRSIIYREISYNHLHSAGTGQAWYYVDSGSYFYNANAYETGGNTATFAGTTWSNNTQFNDSLGGPYGPVVTELGQTWNSASTSYHNSYLYTFTYTNGYYPSKETYQIWDSSNTLTNVYQYNYTYDASNNLLSLTKQTGASLAMDSQYSYTYNSHNLNTQAISMVWNAGAWDTVLKQNFGYDANNNNFQVFGFSWSGTAWVNYSLVTNSFNAATNQITGALTQLWNAGSSTFINSYQEQFIYDFNNNNTQYANFSWNNSTGSWDSLARHIYNYDLSGNNIYEEDATYTNGAYSTTDQYYYTYSRFSLNNINYGKNELAAVIYPNPVSSGQLNVRLGNTDNAMLACTIYDVAGRMISTGKYPAAEGQNELNIPISGLAAGRYYLQLRESGSGKFSVLKFVKE